MQHHSETPLSNNLEYYINHPAYGLAYDNIASYLGIVSMKEGDVFTDDNYLEVFHEAETCVNRVLDAKIPELEIPRVYTYLKNKYDLIQRFGGFTAISSRFYIGCIIQMLFIVALYELLPEKTNRVMKALCDLRTFIERNEYNYIYKKSEMWRLVEERITLQPDRPKVEDLQSEIKQLNEEIEKLKSGDSSTEWHDIVEDTIKPFDGVMRPAGFYEIPKIKQLSRQGQCKFVLKLLFAKVPFKVALLHHVDYMHYMETHNNIGTKTERLRLIEKATGLSKDNRELRGNFEVLRPSSKEDRTKYTSLKHEKEAEDFYLSLLS